MSQLYAQLAERIDKLADRVQLYRDDMVQQHALFTAKLAIIQAALTRFTDDVRTLSQETRDSESDRHALWMAHERLLSQIKTVTADITSSGKAVIINNHTNTQVGDAAVSQQTGTHNDTNASNAGDHP